MALYQITVTRYDSDASEPPTGQTIITCTTGYTLLDDIAEWVTEEIDLDADVTFISAENAQELVRELNPEAWRMANARDEIERENNRERGTSDAGD